MAEGQLYRFRAPSTGRETIIPAEPGRIPTASHLPWAVENLRFCPWCDQLAQKDLNDCPTCGRRMAPFAS